MMRNPGRLFLFLTTLLIPAAAPAADRGWDVRHHDLDVRLDPTAAGIEVTDRFELVEPDDPRRPLHFLLHRDLEIASVRVNGETATVSSRDRWNPRDFYARPDYARLEGFARTRQHTIDPPAGGWPTTTAVEIEYAGAIYDSLQAPDVAYARGFEITAGLIDPRGAFLTSESFWVPWTSEERFTFRLRTELRDGWHSMSQGTRVEHTTDDGVNISVWEETHPQELVYLVAGPYVIRERMHGDVALYTYTYGNTSEDLANTYLEGADRYLDLYGEMYGPYPFEKWAMVENWWQTGFGMPSFTLLGDRVIRLPFIVNTSYGHEILHCWWGNGVYVAYEHGNWSEGLTAYGADYLYKTWESEASAREHRRNQLVGYLDFASQPGRDFPLSEFTERRDFGTQAIGYGKAMMVFHMLERELGSADFQAGLQHFYSTHTFEPSSWQDLEDSFEHVSGRELDTWFEQWVQWTGAPELELGLPEREDDGTWTVRLTQSEPAYELVVPVRVTTPERSFVVDIDMSTTDHLVVLPADATHVAVDPDWHLFRRVHREEIPPTLSQGLGAERSLVVIGSDQPWIMADALRSLAQEWAANQDMVIVDEAELDPAQIGDRGLFLFGRGKWTERALEAATRAFGEEPAQLVEAIDRERDSLVYVVRDPDDGERAWTVFLPEDAQVCAAIGRKIPHYSKYSWLRFDERENVGKGTWTVFDSPLRREVGGEAGR